MAKVVVGFQARGRIPEGKGGWWIALKGEKPKEGAGAFQLLTAGVRIGHFRVGSRPGSRDGGRPTCGIAAGRMSSVTACRFICAGDKNGANTA